MELQEAINKTLEALKDELPGETMDELEKHLKSLLLLQRKDFRLLIEST